MWRLGVNYNNLLLSFLLFILLLWIEENFLLSATGLTSQFHNFLLFVKFSQLYICRRGCYQQSTTTLRTEKITLDNFLVK